MGACLTSWPWGLTFIQWRTFIKAWAVIRGNALLAISESLIGLTFYFYHTGKMGFKFYSRQSISNETNTRQRRLSWQTRDGNSPQSETISSADCHAVIGDSERRLCREIGGALRDIGDKLNDSTLKLHSKT